MKVRYIVDCWRYTIWLKQSTKNFSATSKPSWHHPLQAMWQIIGLQTVDGPFWGVLYWGACRYQVEPIPSIHFIPTFKAWACLKRVHARFWECFDSYHTVYLVPSRVLWSWSRWYLACSWFFSNRGRRMFCRRLDQLWLWSIQRRFLLLLYMEAKGVGGFALRVMFAAFLAFFILGKSALGLVVPHCVTLLAGANIITTLRKC